jgi:hypothetical protein
MPSFFRIAQVDNRLWFKRIFILMAISAISLLSLTGCAHIDTCKYSAIDLVEKTIMVPTNSFGLDARLKKALYRHGWKFGGDQSHYTLTTSWSWDGYCVEDRCPIYKFNISIVDNRAGDVVLKMSGRHSQEAIVPEFNKALENGS